MKTNIFRITILLFCLFTAAISVAQKSLEALLEQYNTRSIPYISVEELRMFQMKDTVLILDSRESNEFMTSHILGARFVGFNDFLVEKISDEIEDKNSPIVVYCSLGIRSEQVGEKLKKAGFTNVQNLYGGIFEWKNNDYPVFNSEEKETKEVHTFSKVWGKWLLKGVPIVD